jgi:tetratricopeptide (TPR) repeat protein
MGCGILLFVAMLTPPFQGTYQRAQSAFEEGRFADAIGLLAGLPGEDALRPAPYNLKALALSELGRYDEALTANQKARDLDPTNPNYVYNEGLIYVAKSDFGRAEQVFRTALAQFPQSAKLLEGLAEALFKLNRFSDAEESLRRAAELPSRGSSVYIAMARLYYALGDEEKLGAAASQAIALDPEDYRACYYYGIWLLEYQHQVEAGARNVRRSIDLQPRFMDGLKAWGRIASHEGRWREAVRVYEQAAEIDAHDDQVFYLLSVAYRKLGEEQKADTALARYRNLRNP